MKVDVGPPHVVRAIPVMLDGKEVVLMTRFLYLLSAAAVAIVLSACTVVLSIGSSVDEAVAASTFAGDDLLAADSADDRTLGGGESIVYRVNVGGTDRDALYLYLDAALDLYVYRDSETLYGTSASADFFAGGRAGLSTVSEPSILEPSAIGPGLICPGSCVILPSDASDPVYVRIRNTSSFDQPVSFYAVLRDFEDTSEAAIEPVLLQNGTSIQGALETLSDVDTYEVEFDGTLEFFGKFPSPITFEAEVTRSDGSSFVLRDAESANVQAFDLVRVYSANDPKRAASAGNSFYSVVLDGQ